MDFLRRKPFHYELRLAVIGSEIFRQCIRPKKSRFVVRQNIHIIEPNMLPILFESEEAEVGGGCTNGWRTAKIPGIAETKDGHDTAR
jgi:hypothetical protein